MSGAVNVTRFKGLGEMNPSQLRESTIHPDTRRLVQLTIDDADQTRSLMDMLLARKRAGDRKAWLEEKGDLATLERSEEHTSELQSLMRNSYAVFCLKKKNNRYTQQ